MVATCSRVFNTVIYLIAMRFENGKGVWLLGIDELSMQPILVLNISYHFSGDPNCFYYDTLTLGA